MEPESALAVVRRVIEDQAFNEMFRQRDLEFQSREFPIHSANRSLNAFMLREQDLDPLSELRIQTGDFYLGAPGSDIMQLGTGNRPSRKAAEACIAEVTPLCGTNISRDRIHWIRPDYTCFVTLWVNS